MATYTNHQISRYLEHIGYETEPHYSIEKHFREEPLHLLTKLQVLHMARVPFESLSLHYSKHRVLSLDPEDLFEKIITRGRGGYCMEVNAFFGTVLRTLGFRIVSVGGRVCVGGGYKGWDHMVNLVTIEGRRYLVDVGFGSNGSTYPFPLEHDQKMLAVFPAHGRLQYKNLDIHTDPDQRVWVYSVQQDESAPWKDMYAFVEIEFFPADFELMNMRTSASPQSFFVQSVMCMKTILDEHKNAPMGKIILHRDYVKRVMEGKAEIIKKLHSEKERIQALADYFDITLTEQEQKGIRGLASELRDYSAHA
ncbi:hypothetical protein QBC35DRAFT_388802 [Podospora australis]|uniref:Arylamine N-acetyltransferase n=1 Tax=Podospora australis TaxID=1536484 RepID=A0AAN6WPL1_9PEZI|nr:hypothetical protein QBC35DRAFT_388802 [Podospora australis]